MKAVTVNLWRMKGRAWSAMTCPSTAFGEGVCGLNMPRPVAKGAPRKQQGGYGVGSEVRREKRYGDGHAIDS